ncbi:MAG: 4Fe-4S single cluster domain-containing protein [Anaerolineaceae bacterium]|nr:4Fe-4S single cluster domain-containing protein [Anaerolineaceae bacterium]
MGMVSILRLHAYLPVSQVNGPGKRFTIWVQGCTLGCPGCFNPKTHPYHSGEAVSVDQLFELIEAHIPIIQGVTISGGEPLQQRRPLETLLALLQENTSLGVILFTGYTWSEVQRMPRIDRLLNNLDVLIAGRYLVNQRLAHGLLGSANKSLHFFSPRHTPADFDSVPSAEVILTPDGQVLLTGIDPLGWSESR